MPDLQHPAAFRAAFGCFSFATLTSIGYGDILPVHPIAGGLSMLEAAVAQIFPTILIGSVVSLSLMEESQAAGAGTSNADDRH